jgi:ribA/ribD-fused uncharacterized protein
MKINNPGQMKRYNANMPNIDKRLWDAKSTDICYTAVKEKFAQNQDLLALLQDTEQKELIEASPYDKIWGIGFGLDEPKLLQKKDQWGKNTQGSILMKIREELKI